jgi:valyl-tRNA synthetase
VSVVVNEGLQLLLPLAGLFDVDKELARLTKQKAKVGQRPWVFACRQTNTLYRSLLSARVWWLPGQS